jgi:hypothetical protein
MCIEIYAIDTIVPCGQRSVCDPQIHRSTAICRETAYHAIRSGNAENVLMHSLPLNQGSVYKGFYVCYGELSRRLRRCIESQAFSRDIDPAVGPIQGRHAVMNRRRR